MGRTATRASSDAREPHALVTCEHRHGAHKLHHHEVWKYCQSTSRVQAEVLQNLRLCMAHHVWWPLPWGMGTSILPEGPTEGLVNERPSFCWGD